MTFWAPDVTCMKSNVCQIQYSSQITFLAPDVMCIKFVAVSIDIYFDRTFLAPDVTASNRILFQRWHFISRRFFVLQTWFVSNRIVFELVCNSTIYLWAPDVWCVKSDRFWVHILLKHFLGSSRGDLCQLDMFFN